MQTSVIEKHPSLKKGPITVRPFFDSVVQNMGLEKYGMAIFDGIFHEDSLGYIEHNGVRRYLTGLNEFAPEILLIENEEEKAAKIKDIRETVSILEKMVASNVVDPKDPEFWNKVKELRPDNDNFWGKITLRISNTPLTLDMKDPRDIIKLRAIEAGGFSIVAKSYENARTMAVPPKFYLDKYEETAVSKNEPRKLKNKALSELQKMFEKNINKLFYVAKVVDMTSTQYKKTTPNDVIYNNMDKYINGESYEKNYKRASQTFLDASNTDMETLKIKALIMDATYYKYLVLREGVVYHMESSTTLGKNIAEAIEFLKNPLNDKILGALLHKVERDWL